MCVRITVFGGPDITDTQTCFYSHIVRVGIQIILMVFGQGWLVDMLWLL